MKCIDAHWYDDEVIVTFGCGRMIFNGVPAGVEVCLSMHIEVRFRPLPTFGLLPLGPVALNVLQDR